MYKKDQTGRTLVEMIVVMVIMAVMMLAVYKIFRYTVDKTRVRNLTQEMTTRVVQLRHQALTIGGIKATEEETAESASLALQHAQSSQSSSGIPIQALSKDTEKFFKLVVGLGEAPLDEAVCEKVLSHFQEENSFCFKEGVCHAEYGEFTFYKFCKGI